MKKPILCLDFDGVIHSYTSPWRGYETIPDPPVPGAIAFLYEAIQHFEVHIFSSRSSQPLGIECMQVWLEDAEKAWIAEQIQANLPIPRTSLLLNIKWPTTKPPAHVTIDDRAITFTGTWPTIESLQTFKPWNKQ